MTLNTDDIAEVERRMRELIADIGPHQTDTDGLHEGVTWLVQEVRRLRKALGGAA